jgi:hypothetical protein
MTGKSLLGVYPWLKTRALALWWAVLIRLIQWLHIKGFPTKLNHELALATIE